MSVQFKEEEGGKLLVVNVSGKLEKADYLNLVPEFDRLFKEHGKLRILFDMSGFHGWELGALWQDIKFDIQHFSEIEKIAMVGETKWEMGMSLFCQPFTVATIRYFDQANLKSAREWLIAA
ncbi:STAS/SEC14 domain-containing protein [Telmatocola sphagniphila]|uniref:STAS/SEC14 domain-containing protein n=1 Tax=Telmatocola sphagniphila TaxID=1123043 RepID=A0A8E6B982_9BACT|nr:STAS/SEC14 domain-containing protein [Telmatocola sphagniphila]QVL34081.1 STAS/SEC14 domain-containing protein [Telmatocola sphagniphila]